jgi:hypothetical protein
MTTMQHTLRAASLLAVLAGLTAARPVAAAPFTIGFEDAAGIPNQAAPNNFQNASNTFKDAYGGTDTVEGVTFSDSFVVFRNTYTNDVGGSDLFGATDGTFALANTDGNGDAGTGPFPAGLDGLMLTTNDVLTGAYFGIVDYGNGSYGSDQVTVTAVGTGGDLGSVTLNLDTSGAPTLTKMDTSAFLTYSGQITGYRINRDIAPEFVGFGGGDYVADDFTFVAPAPEPSSAAGLIIGLLTLIAWVIAGRRSGRLHPLHSESPKTLLNAENTESRDRS